MYGAQTSKHSRQESIEFENDVEMYGAQTCVRKIYVVALFENDVEMYGAQTHSVGEYVNNGVRI